MKSKLLCSNYFYFLFNEEKIQLQEKLFKAAGQIAVSTKDYAITFVEHEVAIELPSGQTVATMNFETSTPALSSNKVVYEDIAQQADLVFLQ